MEPYTPISYLNDFLFCPYSIYLHNVYKGGEEELYQATPQVTGKNWHQNVDKEGAHKNNKKEWYGLEVYSTELGLMGKIDVYQRDTQTLVERKTKITYVYPGYKYQVYAQYFCMLEMGIPVKKLSFYSMKDNATYLLDLPGEREKRELQKLVEKLHDVVTLEQIDINPKKCEHCIYSALCDKREGKGHVYNQ